MKIGNFELGQGRCFIVAEMSCNHNQDLNLAYDIIDAAADAGADAIKFQTYTPKTMGFTQGQQGLTIEEGPWKGYTPYTLYQAAHMPWWWHRPLFQHAFERGILAFSTPYDKTAVDFLEQFDPPCYKIASFELTDLELIRYVASKGRPMILSTGMATGEEIEAAWEATGCSEDNIFMYCISGYPTKPIDVDFDLMGDSGGSGFSDHTLSIGVPVAAVCEGAVVLEKHLTMSRDIPTFDRTFSLEPQEFKIMVQAIRDAEDALWGTPSYDDPEAFSKQFRRAPGGGRGSYGP